MMKKILTFALVVLLVCSCLFSCEKKKPADATDPVTTPPTGEPTQPESGAGSDAPTTTPFDPVTEVQADPTMLQKLRASVYAAAIEETVTVSRESVVISSLTRTYDVTAGTWTESRRVRNGSDADTLWTETTDSGAFSGALAVTELNENDFSAPDDESDDEYRRTLTAAAARRLFGEEDAPAGDVVVTIEARGSAVSVLTFEYASQNGADVSIRFAFSY